MTDWSRLGRVLIVVSIVCLGRAIEIRFGLQNPEAMAWLTAATLSCLGGCLLWQRSLSDNWSRAESWFIALAILLQPLQCGGVPPATQLDVASWQGYRPFIVGLVVASLLLACVATRKSWAARWVMPALIVCHLLMGVWILHHSTHPFIDVWVFQRDACKAMVTGINPYTLTFPNIYGDGNYVYAPELMKDGRLLFGFPYMPLSLWLGLPGHMLCGDFRYSQLTAMSLAALLIWAANPGILSSVAATLLLFTPRGFYVLEQGWTEPYVVFLLALVFFCACRAKWLLPVALGLFVASKQYLIFALPLTLLLVEQPFTWRKWLGLLVPAGVVALLVTLPLALWDIGAFMHSVVTLQFHQPWRPDALSIPAWWVTLGGGRMSIAAAWLALAVGLAVSLMWLPRRAGGFCLAVALSFLLFFVFNKQAFCNYYYFVIGALCCGLAGMQPAIGPKQKHPMQPSR